MYLMYVDESGDTGQLPNSPTRYYVLSAIVFHETNWRNVLSDLVNFRKAAKSRYGLLLKEEIHASVFLNGSPKLKNKISRNDKLDLLKKCLDWLNSRNDISVITVRVEKSTSVLNVFDLAWKTLLQRFENTLNYKNFPGPSNSDKGLVFSDATNGKELTKLIRRMRHYNPIPNNSNHNAGFRSIPLRAIIEDPVFKDSRNSLVIQMCDVIAYFARQYYEPNRYIKNRGAKKYYGRLQNVINQWVKKSPDNFRIIEL